MKAEREYLSRRQWAVGLIRTLILGAISVVACKLMSRNLHAGCTQPASPCQSCGVFSLCGLPRAEQSRQTPAER